VVEHFGKAHRTHLMGASDAMSRRRRPRLRRRSPFQVTASTNATAGFHPLLFLSGAVTGDSAAVRRRTFTRTGIQSRGEWPRRRALDGPRL
jgi:hypothetical protein